MSAKRRAGQRLRQEGRSRRREVLREKWRVLVLVYLVWLALGAPLVAIAGWLYGAVGVAFVLGLWIGFGIAFWVILFNYADSVGSRITDGLAAEENTAAELAKTRRQGWRAVHNLHFERGDVDHVAIGPGGVVVIETKSSSADWGFLVDRGQVDAWARQARGGADRVRHLIKQKAKLDVDPVPLLVTWVQGQPEPSAVLSNGVARVRGRGLRQYLQELPVVLPADEIGRIADALDVAGRGFDERAGVNHPSRLRRVLSLDI